MVLSKASQALSTLVRIAYLAGITLSLFAFFGGTVTGVATNPIVVLAVAGCLSFAVVCHEFLTQGRILSLLGKYFRHGLSAESKSEVWQQLKVHCTSMTLLLLFDAYCGVEYRSGAAGYLVGHDMVQFVIQSIAIVTLYALSSFLTHQDADATSLLNRSAGEMMMYTTKATVAQWKQRIRTARQHKQNLAPATALLMEDDNELDHARRVRIMDSELAKLEAGVSTGTQRNATTHKVSNSSSLYSSPMGISSGLKASRVDKQNGQANRTGAGVSTEGGLSLVRKPRVNMVKTAEQRVHEQLDRNPNLSIAQLQALTKIGSKSTVVKYRNTWEVDNDSPVKVVQNG